MAILSSPLQFISSTPPAARTFSSLLIFLSGTYYWLQWRRSEVLTTSAHLSTPYLTVTPGVSWMYPWTLLTAGFVEKSIIELAFSLICLPISLRYLERLWGTLETFKFIGIVLAVSNVVAFITSWVEYVVLGSETFIYSLDYHGQMALQTGVLVAFTQMIPEHQVQLFGILKMRVKRLPMLYVTFSAAMCIVGYQDPFILIQFGWLVSWTYLRFYKRTGGDTPGGGSVEYGDRSETFAFIHWFPALVQYPVSFVANGTYAVALRLRLVHPHSGFVDLESGTYSPLPGGARAEAERRRAMALKALDQRLANPAQNPGATSQLTHPSHGATSSHHPTSPLQHSDSAQPPRQNSSTSPHTLGPSGSQHVKAGNSTVASHGTNPSIASSRIEEPDGEADIGLTAEKGSKGSLSGHIRQNVPDSTQTTKT